ncbi:CPBP family intramembrane glutamic endopeptidase [Gordonia sp. SL306]|uniref:CPBP family intramembrane glutamic endopeptidase n=1 Tax=Gordonia sp. SL306 TaxID=2995145 RepID=UPI002270A6DB|nr:CPBP family intramembrane glutamic endopeptidase [Gordonia sp. SL306]WAC55548.1 CPBP family intramembrane metalloprotease [Gordonia sp. SL306]
MSKGLRANRRYGAHLGMEWWKPALLVPGILILFLGMQLAFYAVSSLIDGRDQMFTSEMAPTTQLANNLSVAATALIALVVTARAVQVPWRSLLSFKRSLDLRRFAVYGALSTVLIAAGAVTTALIAPESTQWAGFGITGTTVALLAVTVLTAPLQSAGEEVIFRGLIMPATASWVRAVCPALGLGIAVSSILFALVHGSADPWLFAYYVVFGVSTATMAVLSRGLEAPIAFHVVNNLITSILNITLANGQSPTFERSAGAGGPSYLILMAVNVAAVGVIWWREHSREAERWAKDRQKTTVGQR